MFAGFGTTNANPTASSIGFGSPAKPATQGFTAAPNPFGGFGTTTQGSASKPATSFSFGAQPTSSAPATTNSFSFGGSNPTAPAFGSTNQPTSGFGGFGLQTAAQPTAATGSNPFSATTNSTGFSFSQPAFGATQPAFGATQPAFGATQPAFGAAQNSFGFSAQLQPQQQNLGIFAEPIREIKKRYAPFVDGNGNPITQPIDMNSRPNTDCKFKSVNYRKFEASVGLNTKLLDIPSEDAIDRENPDPEKYFPVREYGIAQFQARFESQSTTEEKFTACLKDLKDTIDAVEKRSNQMEVRFQGLKTNAIHLQLTLLSVLRKIEVIRHRSKPLQQWELIYRDNLEKVISAVHAPTKQLQQLLAAEAQIVRPPETFVETVSDEDMVTLFKLLEKQRQFIEGLTDTLVMDIRDVAIMTNTKKG